MTDTTDQSQFAFRPHLDGLRAFAVIAVFVFHASPTALPGGFIGVDVFFVLSGFLITSILLGQIENRTHSLSGFYGRRLRRLLPASLLLLLTVTIVVAVWGSALELSTRLREVRATVFYVANWNLISQSDSYFAEGLDASPLRHMWSLAVEEQFYLLWPIVLALMVAVVGVGRRLLAPILVLAGISFLAMQLRYSPATISRVYYGTDTRVFQPLLGAALAVVLYGSAGNRVRHMGRRSANAMGAFAAVGLTVAAMTLDGSGSAYFRWGALAVALLTVLLIMSGEATLPAATTSVLRHRWVVALGAISYGFYLWHWPIILWLQPPVGADWVDRRLINGLQFIATLALAIASYVLVEQPIRRAKGVGVRRTLALGAAAMLLVVASAGVLLETPTTGPTASALSDRSYEPCPENPRPCAKVDGSSLSSPTVVLVGDSTSQAYDPALKVLAEKYGFRYVQAAVGGCPIGHRFLATGVDGELHKSSNLQCFDEMPSIYQEVLEKYDPDLIMATSWNEPNQHVTDGVLVKTGTPQHLAETRIALDEAIDVLTSKGASMVFIDILPPGPSVECLDESSENEGSCVRPVEQPGREGPYNAIFEQLAIDRDDVLEAISVTDIVCPADACPLTVDDVVVRYDGGHYTATMSRKLAPVLDARLIDIGVDLSSLDRNSVPD